MKTTVILIRHGETIWNREQRIQGQTDIPLSDKGILEAKALAKRIKEFKVDHVYTSVLKRAIHTAEIAFGDLKIAFKRHKGLNERNYGIYEGKNWEEIEKEYKVPRAFYLSEVKNGESKLTFEKRVIKTFKDIVKKHEGRNILIVCHGGVISVLFNYFRNIPKDEITTYRFPNTSVSVVEVEKDKIIEKTVGDTSHLNPCF